MDKFLYTKQKQFELYKGKMQDVLSTFKENYVDSIVTDPPYELNFMNKGWDNSGVAFQKETWEHCYKVLKPGGYLLAFGGSRTFHRIACAIEDAGFEIRDTIMWLYGSGFPKSMALDKSIEGKLTIGSANTKDFKKLNDELVEKTGIGFAKNQFEQGIRPTNYNKNGQKRLGKLEPTTELAKKYKGWGTCLKPAYEPVIVARKPFKGSLVDNVLEYGVGGINIDECRVETNEELRRTVAGFSSKSNIFHNSDKYKINTFEISEAKCRFPANVILTYDDTDFEEVCGGFPYTDGSEVKEKGTYGFCFQEGERDSKPMADGYNDKGSASRYFYCAKASKKDRDEGLDSFESKQLYYDDRRGNSFDIFVKRDEKGKALNETRKNIHPTVKPVELMQYLVRLITPKGGTILDCFMGSGSTGKAVMFENRERDANYKFIGVEMTEEYLPICESRIDYALNKYEYEEKKEKEIREQNGTPNIFDFLED